MRWIKPMALTIASNEQGRSPFIEIEGRGNAPISRSVYYQPTSPNRWQVRLWAKRGKLSHEVVVECENPITITEMIEDLGGIVDDFLKEFGTAMENEVTALRLEGKFSDAYKLEGKAPRYGYLAYELD